MAVRLIAPPQPAQYVTGAAATPTPCRGPCAEVVTEYMADCRKLVLDHLTAVIPVRGKYGSVLYDLMLDYPFRQAKALRPALCIATARALGGSLEAILNSASVLELYHNAFLIHDDIEDSSMKRRGAPTLHRSHGVPIAINVGDAMLALALEPLFDNMRLIGLGKALQILRAIAEMARHTAEGQALELGWIREARWVITDADYLRMVHKKTSWYTFITPVNIGGVVGGASSGQLACLRIFATALGAAFQIQDDILNVSADRDLYDKDLFGDLWEGKHTLIVLHALRAATANERSQALSILAKPRPEESDWAAVDLVVEELWSRGQLTQDGREKLQSSLEAFRSPGGIKSESDIAFLRDLIERYGSVTYAREVARRRAARAQHTFARIQGFMKSSIHREFIAALMNFVVERQQ